MRVICPVDVIEAHKATRAITHAAGPCYMRTSRAPFPVITQESDPFVIGQSNQMREGGDVTLIACGLMVYESLMAAEIINK
jgi:transketolase